MQLYQPYLLWIESQKEEMIHLVESWSNINSGSDHIQGLENMITVLKNAFSTLNANIKIQALPSVRKIDSKGVLQECPLGKALILTKRPEAAIKVFLGGHFDTVYAASSPFQKTERSNQNILRGPGVADMKGGLVIMLKALEAFEKSPFASKIGWEVLLNPDEEIGSPGSDQLLIQSAKRNHIGFIFEPSFADGALVSSRKGSLNGTILVKGKSAHAGRDFQNGISAIYILAEIIRELEQLIHLESGTTVNVGYVEGGGPLNIVPDLAICRVNIRAVDREAMEKVCLKIDQIVQKKKERQGISVTWYEESNRPPKPFDGKTERLFFQLKTCGESLGFSLDKRTSGGGSDGNNLSAHGLPVIDTLGAIGGNLHTPEEYMLLSSLTERASLVALYLMKLAHGEFSIPTFDGV